MTLSAARLLAPLALLSLLGCGKIVPPPSTAPSPSPAPSSPSEAAAPRVAEQSSPVGEQAPSADPEPDVALYLRWSVEGRPDSERAAVGPEGRVVVTTRRHVTLYDGGELIAERPSCAALATSFVSAHRLAVICPRELVIHTLPSLDVELRQPLADEAVTAAFVPGYLAIAFADHSARSYDAETLAQLDALNVGQPITALALDRNAESLFIGLEGGDLVIRDRNEGESLRQEIKPGLPVHGLVPAPGDRALLVAAGPLVEIWSLAELHSLRRFSTVSGLDDAGWLSDGTVVSVGRDGLLALDPETGAARSLGGGVTSAQPGSRLAVDARGQRFCVVEPDGRLSCYGRGGASTRQVVRPIVGGLGATSTNGRVVTFSADRLEVHAHPQSPRPEPGTLVRVYRYRRVTVGGVRSVRWIDTTEGKVRRLEGDVIEVEVGELRNADGLAPPLVADVPVKLVWVSPDAASGPGD